MITATFLLLSLAAGLAVVAFALGKRNRCAQAGSFVHPQGFSPDLYAPMLRLLDPAELAFVASQRGYTRDIGRALRRRRQQVLRQYLKALQADFGVLDRAAHLLLMHSPVERKDLARSLALQRMVFYRRLFALHCAAQAYAWGWDRVPAAAVVDSCEALRSLTEQLRAGLVPTAVI